MKFSILFLEIMAAVAIASVICAVLFFVHREMVLDESFETQTLPVISK
jgi:hypothetical protein